MLDQPLATVDHALPGQRIVKQGRGGDSITIGQFFSLKGKVAATKHVFVGETRLASKVLPPPGWVEGLAPVTTAPATTLPGCDPSNYNPQKCPYLPGTEPVTYGAGGTTTVRPETYYYHADHLGSTSWVTDQNGKVHEHVEYYPYGEVWWEPRYDRDGADLLRPTARVSVASNCAGAVNASPGVGARAVWINKPRQPQPALRRGLV